MIERGSIALRLYMATEGWPEDIALHVLNANPKVGEVWNAVAREVDEIVEENLAPFLTLQDRFDRLRETVHLAQLLREKQKQYFKTRDRGDLVASKEAERAFDAALKEALNPGLALVSPADSGDAA